MQRRHCHSERGAPAVPPEGAQGVGPHAGGGAASARNADGRPLFRAVAVGISDAGDVRADTDLYARSRPGLQRSGGTYEVMGAPSEPSGPSEPSAPSDKKTDFREIEINLKDSPVVYCDPPYRGTADYGIEFDFSAFDEWCRTRPFPVYISEYTMPEDFVPIWQKSVAKLMGNNSGKATEKLWVHRRWAEDGIFTGTLF